MFVGALDWEAAMRPKNKGIHAQSTGRLLINREMVLFVVHIVGFLVLLGAPKMAMNLSRGKSLKK